MKRGAGITAPDKWLNYTPPELMRGSKYLCSSCQRGAEFFWKPAIYLLSCFVWVGKQINIWDTCGRNPEHYGTSILDRLKNALVRLWLLISYELHVFLTKRTPCVYSTSRGLKPFRVGVTVSLYRLLYRQFANLLCKGSLVLDLCRRVWRRGFNPAPLTDDTSSIIGAPLRVFICPPLICLDSKVVCRVSAGPQQGGLLPILFPRESWKRESPEVKWSR